MAGRSPAQPRRRRRRRRGWSSPSKASSRRRPRSPPPSSSPPAAGAQQPALLPGTAVEVRVDDDGFHGSWFEATVDDFLPARGRGSRARYTVTYAHLLSDDSGASLVEPFAPSRIRPRPPPPPSSSSSPEPPLGVHDIVEAFHNDGWWSGIVLAADPITVAFPITREVITFHEPRHVRPRRDYVGGRWVPSPTAIAVQPKRAVRVYEVGDKVEVVRDREVYGYSWFPATVAKVIDRLSYLVEYFDLEVEGAGGKAVEYLHCLFIRPAVEHFPRESEFQLRPGAAVEAYCDGAWSPGVVRRVVGEGEYEVSIEGKETEVLINRVPELLKPQYKWDGKHWRIVSPKVIMEKSSPKRHGTRRQSVSGKRPSSPVEVASSDDEHRRHTESSVTKRSRKELPQKKVEVLTEGSEHGLQSELDTTLSALRKSLASNHSPKSCSPLSGKNNFQVLSQRIVSDCAIRKEGFELVHASSEHPSPQNESSEDVIGEVVNQEILCDMMLSGGQINTPICGISADETCDMLSTAGLRKQKMDSYCINNAAQQTQQSPLFVQALQVSKYTFKHKGGEMHPIQALLANSDASDNVQIQLKGNTNISSKEIICSLAASTCNTPPSLDKQLRAPDAVSRGAGGGSNMKIFASKKSAKKEGFKDSSSSHSTLDPTSSAQKRGRKKVAGRLKESSIERQLERNGPHIRQQLNRNLEDTTNVNEGTNQEMSPLVSPGFGSICNRQDGGEVDERPIQRHIRNAGSSQCTSDNTLSRSCSVAGNSLPSTLPSCQIIVQQVPFVKTSPMWNLIKAMEVFQEVPQQPHFLPLQQFMPELREGMALGLMVTYAGLVESVKKLCIAESIASFEGKINALAHLEENGFDVRFLQHSLNKLLQIKCDHTKHLGNMDKLNELVPGKESAVSRKHALLDEKDKAIFQLEQKLEQLRGEAEQIARETKDEDKELFRLKADVNIAQEACGDDELQFHSILAELRSRPKLSN